MKITVRLFAAYREAAGWDQKEFALEEGALAQHLWDLVRQELRDLSPRTPLCARNEQHSPMDTLLQDGDDVAFFPPVSGGDSDSLWADPDSLVVQEPIDTKRLAKNLVTDECGALCSFEGIVRDHHDGRSVEAVTYEGYPEMAGKELARLCSAAEAKWPGTRTVIVHRVGKLLIGEVSVAILAAAAHRAEAFDAARFLIEEIKKSAPIWKKDHFADGETSWRDV